MTARIFPFIGWFRGYDGGKFRADFVAGLTVAMVLVPQSMAYAQLAGLPAYYGLYAAFVPPMIAAMFGSSHQLATGPVAIVSLMTNTALAPLAASGSSEYAAYAVLLALLVGAFQFALGVLRLGVVVNFLSHPVVNGFTNAAAIIIATSQLSKIFGVTVDQAEHHYETVRRVAAAALEHTHLPSVGMAALAFGIMLALKKLNPRIPNVLAAVIITTVLSWAAGFEHDIKADIENIHSGDVIGKVRLFNGVTARIEEKSLERVGLTKKIEKETAEHGKKSLEALRLRNESAVLNFEINHLKEQQLELRSALRRNKFGAVRLESGEPMFFLLNEIPEGMKTDGRTWRMRVGFGTLKEDGLEFAGGGSVVGKIPSGIPMPERPAIDLKAVLGLLPMAVIISVLGFMEAISIAKAMAAKTGQRLDPNQELLGQGLANLVGSGFRSYAVSGSFSRSAVNLQAGAETGLSSVISSVCVGITLLFFTPLLYHLPQAVLAAIIMMAVVGLINVSGFVHAWQVQKYDGAISVITFVATLYFAPHLDRGILIGVALSLGLYLLRNTRPDIAILSLHQDGSYRSALKHGLEECRHVAAIRFNGSLFFANVSYLESIILEEIGARPEMRHILLVCNGINELDASGEEMLSVFVDRLREGGHDISFSGFNDHVIDVMKRTHLYEKIGEDHMFRNVQGALQVIHSDAHRGYDEEICPLKMVAPKAPVQQRVGGRGGRFARAGRERKPPFEV
ncbi:MAG: SulP family inorganic anion transporter [bacterium]